MADMLSKLSKGLGVGAFVEGMGNSLLGADTDGSNAETAGELAQMIGSVVKKVTGKDIPISAEMAQQIAGLISAAAPSMQQEDKLMEQQE